MIYTFLRCQIELLGMFQVAICRPVRLEPVLLAAPSRREVIYISLQKVDSLLAFLEAIGS
jgi:hypothetical protein